MEGNVCSSSLLSTFDFKMSSITRKVTVGEVVNGESSAKFLWKIVHYTSLPHDVDHCIESPRFKFLGTTWYIRVFLNGQRKDLSEGCVGLYILKQRSTSSIQPVGFTLKILKNDNSDYHCQDGEAEFRGVETGWGFRRFLKKDKFLSDIAKILLKDTLRIFCVLRVTSQVETTGEAVSFGGSEEVLEDFEKLLISKEDSDLLVRVKGEEFKVHRAILIARSPVFKAMFRSDMAEGKSGIVDIIDCDPVAFRDFLLFLYCGRVDGISADNALDLYFIADKYDVKNLKLKCISFLMDYNTSVDNFCDVIMLALKENAVELIQKTTNFFMEYAMRIIRTAKWITFLKEYPEEANELYIKAMIGPKPKILKISHFNDTK